MEQIVKYYTHELMNNPTLSNDSCRWIFE